MRHSSLPHGAMADPPHSNPEEQSSLIVKSVLLLSQTSVLSSVFTRIMAASNSPHSSPSSPPPLIPDDTSSQPPTSEGYSAFYIESIFTTAKLIGWILASIVGILVVYYTVSSKIPIVIKLGATASAFSQIGLVRKLVRRMRRVERGEREDLEAGIMEDADVGEGQEEVELEERGRLSARGERKGGDRK
jgi:hypothetical protein